MWKIFEFKLKVAGQIAMEAESLPNWEFLPAKNLQDIFRNLQTCDAHRCLQVCKNWYNEGNFFLKDKLWFSIAKVKSVEDLQASKRRFQFLKIYQAVETDDLNHLAKNFRCWQGKASDTILETYIEYDDYPSLSIILNILNGKHVKILTLHHFKRTETIECRVRNAFGLLGLYDFLDYGCLSSVEQLSVVYLDNSLLNLSKSFGHLRSLTLKTMNHTSDMEEYPDSIETISEELLKNLIDLNPIIALNLEKAAMFIVSGFLFSDNPTRIPFTVQSLLSFENVKNLKALHLNIVKTAGDIEVLAKHFKHLEMIRIRYFYDKLFHPSYVNRISNLPNFAIENAFRFYNSSGFDFNNNIFRDSWTNHRSFNVTHMYLSADFIIRVDTCRVFFKALPNMKSFKCWFVVDPVDISWFCEMSKSWPKLQSLSIGFDSEFLASTKNEVINFPNLTTLCLDCISIMEGTLQFFTLLKAVNLKCMMLDPYHNFGDLDLVEKIFEQLSGNCPSIRRFELRGTFDMQVLSFLLSNLLNLRELNINSFDVDDSEEAPVMITDILEVLLKIGSEMLSRITVTTDFRLENLEGFCETNRAITDFKDGKLRRILIQNKEIFLVHNIDKFE